LVLRWAVLLFVVRLCPLALLVCITLLVRDDIVVIVVVGLIISPQDILNFYVVGVATIAGPGNNVFSGVSLRTPPASSTTTKSPTTAPVEPLRNGLLALQEQSSQRSLERSVSLLGVKAGNKERCRFSQFPCSARAAYSMHIVVKVFANRQVELQYVLDSVDVQSTGSYIGSDEYIDCPFPEFFKGALPLLLRPVAVNVFSAMAQLSQFSLDPIGDVFLLRKYDRALTLI